MKLAQAERIGRASAAFGTAGLAVMATLGLLQGLRRPKGRSVGRPYRRLPWQLFVGLGLVYGVLAVRLWRPLPPSGLSGPVRAVLLVVGSVLYWVGVGFTLSGRVALGAMYDVSTTTGAELYADHRLVTGGPYAVVRHPMYAGVLVSVIGSALLYRTWTTLFILAHVPVFWVRARREEQVLAAAFGTAWEAYRCRVPAGVPGL